MNFLYHIGKYFMMLKSVFKKPQNRKIYTRQILTEFHTIGKESVLIVAIISLFMGAAVSLQLAFNIDFPLIPKYTIGFATRQSVVLEFSPTLISILLAGTVGSSIASGIGTMRVTEQIDALEIMGVNSSTYLILPKIVAFMLVNPLLIMMSMIIAVFGGWLIGVLTGAFPSEDYIYGVRSFFRMYDIYYALIKTVVFAFIISSISAYFGYNVRGGSLEVAKASTNAVIYSSITIIIFNLMLTQLLLS